MSTPNPTGSASLSDILTAAKNLVVAVNGLTQAYLNVQGALNAANIRAATVIKGAAGRVARVSVITAGSSVGMIYDASTIGSLTKPLWPIPNTANSEPFEVNLPASFGILVQPGTGQVVTVSYS
jgi:hypothetical protein